jgi:TonB family protein
LATSSGGTEGFQPEELDEIPAVLRHPSRWEFRSFYPEREYQAHHEADVKVELLVDESGAVTEVRIIEGAGPDFDAAAKRLGQLLRYTPGLRHGRPVKMHAYVVFNFRIERL